MKIDLIYPKIVGTKNFPVKDCIGFEKCDGSNTHFCWNKDRGFYAFGTRRSRYDLNAAGIDEFKLYHKGLEDVIPTFEKSLASLEDDNLLRQHSDVTLFAEFLGERSFAGSHIADDDKKLVLFDVLADGNFLSPWTFVEKYGDLKDCNAARVVYSGRYNGQLINDIRTGKFDVKEGVVLKGVNKDTVYRAKIKTDAYLARLKEAFNDKWIDYWE